MNKPHGKDINTARKGVSLEHRHFAFIASVIAAMPNHAPSLRAQQASCAEAFARACAGTNGQFKRERFMAACQLPD